MRVLSEVTEASVVKAVQLHDREGRLVVMDMPTPPSATPIQNWIPEDDSGRSWTQLGTAPRPPTARSTNGHRIVKRGGLNDGDRWA